MIFNSIDLDFIVLIKVLSYCLLNKIIFLLGSSIILSNALRLLILNNSTSSKIINLSLLMIDDLKYLI